MLKSMILDIIKNHLPLWCYLTVALMVATFKVNDTIQVGLDNFRSEIITDSRQVVYELVESLVEKQALKKDKDPKDLKFPDIKYGVIQCNGDYGQIYVPNLPPDRKINAERNCKAVEEMYISAKSY